VNKTDLIFQITERIVQKQLKIVCDDRDYEGVSTHRFRKRDVTGSDNANSFDIALVQRRLQHSSASAAQRYIDIEPRRANKTMYS